MLRPGLLEKGFRDVSENRQWSERSEVDVRFDGDQQYDFLVEYIGRGRTARAKTWVRNGGRE